MDVEDGLPPWARVGQDEPSPPRRGRRPWILIAAVVPWTLVLALVVLALLRDDGPGPSAVEDPRARTHAPDVEVDVESETDPAPPHEPARVGPLAGADAGGAAQRPPEGSQPPTGTPAAVAATEATLPPADAAAVTAVTLAVARAWLTDVGPRLEIDGIEPEEDRYLEHAAVERIEHHGDHAVATVLAVVLTRDGDHYVEAQPRRMAVPVRLGEPPQPAGPPWWLHGVELTPAPPRTSTESTEDELVMLAEALGAAGHDEELVTAATTPDGWWLAELETGAQVWLLPGTTGPVVAGTAPASDGGLAHDDEG